MTKLGDVLETLVDCEHKTSPIDESGDYFAVGTPAMQGNSINLNEARRISLATFEQWTRRLRPRVGDLLFAREAPVGPIVRIPREENIAPGQRTVLMRPDRDLVHPDYLFYALATPAAQSLLLEKAAGSTVTHLNVADIRSFEFPWGFPDLARQTAIAQVLGALDDKIAANVRMGVAADSLVRATVEGIAGEDVKVVGAIADNHRVQSSPPFTDDDYVGLEHVPRRHMWMMDSGAADSLASGKFRFEPGDVLFGKLRPYFHKVVVADRSGVCSTDILVLRSRNPDLRGLVWGLLASDAVVERVSAMTEGTRMPRTNWSDLAACEVPWPSESSAEELSSRIESLGARASAAQAESRMLADLRDTLLPHLMSGRISVRHAEAVVSEAL